MPNLKNSHKSTIKKILRTIQKQQTGCSFNTFMNKSCTLSVLYNSISSTYGEVVTLREAWKHSKSWNLIKEMWSPDNLCCGW
jgi:ribosomal protein S3AE